MRKILGLSCFYHDSSATIIIGDDIIAAAQEERFTRLKNDSSFPLNAIKFCLEETGLTIDELDAIVFYDKPLLKLERILKTFYIHAPKGISSFLKAIPRIFSEKIFFKKTIKIKLEELCDYKKKPNILFTEHHLAHAASAFYPSQFGKAAILTIDGVGEWATTTLSIGIGNKIKILKELRFPNSLGLLYSSFTYYLGFEVNSGEYKTMGLAPFGNAESSQVEIFIELIKTELVNIKGDGSIWLNQKYFNYSTGLSMVKEKKWKNLFGFSRRTSNENLEQIHCDLAYALQKVTEEIIINLALEIKKITKADNLCLAGGVALNCVAVAKLQALNIFKDIFVQPASGDSGGSLGAALATLYIYYNHERKYDLKLDKMKGAFLGPTISDREIHLMNLKVNAVFKKFEDFNLLQKYIADKISAGKIIGWVQGKMEFGPRALGNRSILCDPRKYEVQGVLNAKIKKRESFRPFAPSILAEDKNKYFEIEKCSPYMTTVTKIKPERRNVQPKNFEEFTLKQKLDWNRGELHSVTHLDFSSRIQTVHRHSNFQFWGLINEFKNISGCSVLLNTSFNRIGEPIVCNSIDAYNCFLSAELDYLVLNDFVYCLKDQSIKIDI